MSRSPLRFRGQSPLSRAAAAILCAAFLVPGEGLVLAQATPPAPAAAPAAPKVPPAQLDALVAPIALYADPLLAQVLVASTYPLELMQLQQWLVKNKGLKDKALADAVAKQPWDPSIQSMAAFPEAVKRLTDDIQWATDLGNAFLAQQPDVMDAVQRMRKKAKDNGALKTTQQQKVETTVVEQKTIIVVQPASPEVIYVPSYSPVVVYGPPVYPYPPIYYPPPPPPGAAFMTFTAGVMMGAAISGGTCCGCGWGHNDVTVNVNNNYNKNTNVNYNKNANVNANKNTNVNASGSSSWQHNSQHRGGAPYSNQATASKYSGTTQGAANASRQASAQQSTTKAGAGASPSANAASTGTANRSGGGAGAGASASASAARSGGGSGSSGAFGGGSGGYSGNSASASSARGASSMSSKGGGGGGSSRSGGGRKR